MLIPTLNSCLSRMTASEKKFANILESHLEDGYYCWYDVPIGRKSLQPDFIILHPNHGLLVLEVKDWKLATLADMSREHKVVNPINQARSYVLALINILSRDPQLTIRSQNHKCQTVIGYGYGVVLANITRAQFDQSTLGKMIPKNCVICKDELLSVMSPEELQHRLRSMFPYVPNTPLSSAQIDRIRWHIFPELRIGYQCDLFTRAEKSESNKIPDVLKVMDVQQEQLARSLGEGHRVIHGVAGSGKTMILRYRAEYLAQILERPILVLCYNRNLAASLKYQMEQSGINYKVHVRTFHQWCHQQLDSFNIPKSRNVDVNQMLEENVQKVIDHVEQGTLPKAQYDAILIDEGHDFEDKWYELIVQMVNPDNPSLLVLYDDAQSVCSKERPPVTFSHVGIQARGRTTILKLNYRNTKEILSVAKLFAEDLLASREADDDSVPLLEPIGAGSNGIIPSLVKLPTATQEVTTIIDILYEHQRNGVAWSEMAVLCRTSKIINSMKKILAHRGIPVHGQEMEDQGVHLLTMHSSKGLEFPLVCIPGVGNKSICYEAREDEAQLLYVAMTRATRNLVMTCHESSMFAPQIETAISKVSMMN